MCELMDWVAAWHGSSLSSHDRRHLFPEVCGSAAAFEYILGFHLYTYIITKATTRQLCLY
jgi:hypothetical protein